ncbi:MAG: hypothetical protein AAF447_12760 [Myxococcota bacterium]
MQTRIASRAGALLLFVALVACGGEEPVGPQGPDLGPVDGGTVPDAGAPVVPEGEVFDPETLGRLSVADANVGRVSVWDLDVPVRVTDYDLTAPATLYRSSSRQITSVVAAQASAGRFDVFGVGVWVWDHVDHFHVYKDMNVIQVDEDLALTSGVDELQVNGGWVFAFDDATGSVNGLFERSIGPLRTDVPRSRLPIFKGVEGAAHDGVAVVARGQLFATNADGGVNRYRQTADDFVDPEMLSCEAPGAGTAAGLAALFDCGSDLLLSRWDEEAEVFEDLRVALPEGATRPTSLLGEDDLPVFVGPVAGGLLLVDRESAIARFVALDADAVAIAPDRDGTLLLVLDGEGRLLDLDPETGAERRRLNLAAELGGTTLTHLAVGQGHAYIAEPDAGRVQDVDLETFTAAEPLDVGGRPGSLVVTALWPGGEPTRHE